MPPEPIHQDQLGNEDDPSTPVEGVTSRFLKYPSKRDKMSDKTPNAWLHGFRDDSNVWPYWRIHNSLYDLQPFVDKHPGGKFWLTETQGCDITELYESSHLSEAPKQILSKFYVKNISSPRNSPFTFEEDDFYMTLKKKVIPILKETSTHPTRDVYLVQDGVFLLFIASLVSSAIVKSYLGMVLTGAILAACFSIAHNFSHKKDCWRMYIMDFSMISSRDWRISHVFSHHVFPNTVYDFEVSAFEPFVELHPKPSKNLWIRFAPWVTCILVFILVMPVQYGKTWLSVLLAKKPFRWEFLIPIAELAVVTYCAGTFLEAFGLFLCLHGSCSFWFVAVSMVASHHHLDNFIDGDKCVGTRDWGIHQLIATMPRNTEENLLIKAIAFGDHPLHHLFPTLDMTRLPQLLPILKETCKEFGFIYEGRDPGDMMKGLFKRMAQNKPNTQVPKSARLMQ